MRSTFAVVAAFAALAVAAPQGVTADITPTAAAPAGCTATYPLFELSVVNASTATSKKSKRADTLEIKLEDGILTDSEGRRGYIAANYQFQFDVPPVQTGALYTGGFTVCDNGTLALGGSAVWWECLSGNFYNLYDKDWAAQCKEIFLDTIKVGSSISVSTAAATTTSDGQVGASTAAASLATVTTSADVVSTISDSQPQAATTTTAITSSISITTSSVAIVSTISDNQIQAPTATTATTSSIEVISATTSTAAVTTSVALISSISDYQIQAPTTTTAVTSSIAVVSNATATVEPFTGAASMPTMAAQFMLAAAGLAALAL